MSNQYLGELVFYKNGESIDIPLTKIQSITILKVLGLNLNTNEKTVEAYSDSMLKRFLASNYKDNPLHYKLSSNIEVLDETKDF